MFSPFTGRAALSPISTRNVVHRHEPPVTNTPVKILHHDVEREFVVVDKPGSIVRASTLSIVPLFDTPSSPYTHLVDISEIPSPKSLSPNLALQNPTVRPPFRLHEFLSVPQKETTTGRPLPATTAASAVRPPYCA